MSDESVAIRAILRNLRKEGLNPRVVTKEINYVTGSGTGDESVTQRGISRFKEGDNSLEEKPMSERPSVVQDEILL